jgi:hypothetical protein
MKSVTAVALTYLVLGQTMSGPASAGECIRRPEAFKLRSDTANWSITIGAGGECLQGLRGRAMLLDGVKLVEAPKLGVVSISGPSFRYRAPATPSSDSFRLEVAGEDHRVRGVSTIQVDVVVR